MTQQVQPDALDATGRKRIVNPDTSPDVDVNSNVAVDDEPQVLPRPDDPAVNIDHGNYTENRWNGFPRFACNFCPFDDISEDGSTERVEDHYRQIHAPPVPPVTVPMSALVLDRYGNAIEKRPNPEAITTNEGA